MTLGQCQSNVKAASQIESEQCTHHNQRYVPANSQGGACLCDLHTANHSRVAVSLAGSAKLGHCRTWACVSLSATGGHVWAHFLLRHVFLGHGGAHTLLVALILFTGGELAVNVPAHGAARLYCGGPGRFSYLQPKLASVGNAAAAEQGHRAVQRMQVPSCSDAELNCKCHQYACHIVVAAVVRL